MRAISIVIAAIAIAAALLFWTTRQQEQAVVEARDTTAERPTISDPAAPAPSAPATASERADWFPDLGDRGEIPGLADGVTEGRATFGCDIGELLEDAAPMLARADRGVQDPRLDALVDALSASADAELLLANVAARNFQANAGPEESYDAAEAAAFDDLARAVQADATNPLVLWYASWYCAAASDTTVSCEDPVLQGNVEAILGANGVYWARDAGYLYSRGEHDAALDALKRSATSPTFDSYFIENVRLMERALSLAPDVDYIERAVAAYAMTEDMMSPGYRLARMCETQAVLDDEWFAACMSVAQRGATEGRTIAERLRAADLLGSLHMMSGDMARRDDALALSDHLQQAMRRQDDFAAVVLTDERVMSQFFEEFEAGDELSATLYVQTEVERLRRDPDFDPCPAGEADD
ncbi:MAG: hypothetical protein QNI99_05880 [Woeseiaceae bacterium]|nr:hypothetical protein [Woeseiaceae bacterium]